MMSTDKNSGAARSKAPVEVAVDWEALEDAFENNAPEVHSYLHLSTGEVLRVVDGIADPQMHSRIAADAAYVRVEPVSSREQYRWMERFIQMLDPSDLRDELTLAIDGRGAFRRFKDVLMAHAPERERWFAFRSERLRVFMEAWLSSNGLTAVARPVWAPEVQRPREAGQPISQEQLSGRRGRSAEALRTLLRELAETLGARDLEKVTAFAEFVKARRAARGFAHRHEGVEGEEGGGDESTEPPRPSASEAHIEPPVEPRVEERRPARSRGE